MSQGGREVEDSSEAMEPEPAEEAEPPTDATETEKRRGSSSKDAHTPAPRALPQP